jgi:REP-associated tyrosine transposase
MKRFRKNTRLKDYDYSESGYYFVTICTKDHQKHFGEISTEKMQLSDIGDIAKMYWQGIPIHFADTLLDEFIIMPNHIHGIVILDKSVGNADLRSLPKDSNRSKMQLSKIIHGFKSSVTRTIHKTRNNNSFIWQKSFYDHVISNEQMLNKIREYILNNPLRWVLDKYYLEKHKFNARITPGEQTMKQHTKPLLTESHR